MWEADACCRTAIPRKRLALGVWPDADSAGTTIDLRTFPIARSLGVSVLEDRSGVCFKLCVEAPGSLAQCSGCHRASS